VTLPLDSQKIAAARLWAATKLPYLASALFASRVIANPECGTVAVDKAWQIYADPSAVEALNVEDLGKLLIHLAGHLLRDHAERAVTLRAVTLRADSDGDRATWNRATDAEINDDLARDGLVPRVAPDLPADLGCDDGQLAETYFGKAAPGPRHWDCGSGCDGCDRGWDAPNGLGAQRAQLICLGVASEVQRYNVQNPGTVPGGWLRWAESIRPSRVDWRRVLAGEIRRAVASVAGNVDYTYRRPSRRAGSVPKVILPAMHRPIPNVAVVCDTSGSMHEQLLARALTEVEGLLTRGGLRQAQIRVLAVDTNVHAVRRVSRVSQVELAGGGGTDMGAGIAAAAALRPRPSVIVVLTDGFTPWPDKPPKAVRVVVGLLTQSMIPVDHFAPPTWARIVRIEPDAFVRG
jgi:predicted metal-dependent peptidase